MIGHYASISAGAYVPFIVGTVSIHMSFVIVEQMELLGGYFLDKSPSPSGGWRTSRV